MGRAPVLAVGAGEVFRGAAAVITVPLGCLKAGAIAFQPPLPAWKADAIAKLGFGNLNKVGFCLLPGSSDTSSAARYSQCCCIDLLCGIFADMRCNCYSGFAFGWKTW